jgi:hypothetical protein
VRGVVSRRSYRVGYTVRLVRVEWPVPHTDEDHIKEEGLKLSAFLCQLATIGKKEYWSLIDDSQEIVKNWNKDLRLDFYKPLFALHALRLADAHGVSVGDPTAQASNLKVFNIEPHNLKPAGDLTRV